MRPEWAVERFDYYPAGPDLTPSLPRLTRAVDAIPGARLQPIRTPTGVLPGDLTPAHAPPRPSSGSTISAILDVMEDVVMGHRPDCGR